MEMQTTPPPPKNSQNPKMDVVEILSKSNPGKDAKNIYALMSHTVNNDPNFRVMRANNTLFTYYNLKDGSIEAHMDTADNPRQLVDSIKQFMQACKAAKFKTIKFEVANPQIIKAVQMAGGNPQMSGIQGQSMQASVEV
jgi:hypothetical protein